MAMDVLDVQTSITSISQQTAAKMRILRAQIESLQAEVRAKHTETEENYDVLAKAVSGAITQLGSASGARIQGDGDLATELKALSASLEKCCGGRSLGRLGPLGIAPTAPTLGGGDA